MVNVHPALVPAFEALNRRLKAGTIMPEDLERAKRNIVRAKLEMGRVEASPMGKLPMAYLDVRSPAQIKAQEDAKRTEAVRLGRIEGLGFVQRVDEPSFTKQDPRTSSKDVRVLTAAEQHAITTALAAQAAAPKAAPITVGVGLVQPGYEVRAGVIRPKAAPAAKPDARIEAIRADWKAGALTLAQAKERVAALPPIDKPTHDVAGRPIRADGWTVIARVQGAPVYETGRSTGYVDPVAEPVANVHFVLVRDGGKETSLSSDRGDKALRLMCDLLLGNVATEAEDNSRNLRPVAPATLREATLTGRGIMVHFSAYTTICMACNGTAHNRETGATCTACDGTGRTDKSGLRHYFGPECTQCRGSGHGKPDKKGKTKECSRCNGAGVDPETPEDRAHNAGLASMNGFDAHVECGRESCRGQDPAVLKIDEALENGRIDQDEAIRLCRGHKIAKVMGDKGRAAYQYCPECKDLALGGYARDCWIKCPDCKGSGKVLSGPSAGEQCPKCHGKRGFWGKERFWTSGLACPKCRGEGKAPNGEPCGFCSGECRLPSFDTNRTIRRGDLLAEALVPKRFRNQTIQTVSGSAEVSPACDRPKGKPAMHLQGTARNRFDRATKDSNGQGGWAMGQKVSETRVTFSRG